ncbi:MAG: acyltransferase [Actinomycetota bacterium]|nr:acyltransferase [Actinomycetota bacterium]
MNRAPEPAAGRIANLDGLRAFSILLVFCFHAQLFGVTGGFIGVSVFFTLSGYLLARLLLARPLDGAAIGRYWQGRLRRILPAAWAVLIAIVVYEWWNDVVPVDAAQRLWFTATGLGNWLQLATGGDYAAMFERPDMLVHYWSLAVEMQVYLVLPVVLLLCMRLPRWGQRIGVVGALAAASFAAPLVFGLSVARTYYGSDTRAGELLAGVCLAMWHHSRPFAAHAQQHGRRHDGLVLASIGGVIAISLLIGPADAVIRLGLLPALAMLSLGMLHGSARSPRVLGGALEWWPLRRLGELSYPVYLLHWPLIVVLNSHQLPKATVALVAAAGSVLLSVPIMRLIEAPIRRRSTPTGVRLVALGAALALIAVVSVAAHPAADAQFLNDLEDANDTPITQRATTTTDAPSTAPPTNEGSTPATTTPGATTLPATTVPATTGTVPVAPSLIVLGDSAALSLALVLANNVPIDQVNMVANSTMLGCGIVQQLEPARCAEVPEQWSAQLAATPAEVALVMSCQWELVERQVPGHGSIAVGDPALDAIIADAYRAAMQRLLNDGVRHVVWVLCPEYSQTQGWPTDPTMQRSRDPRRVVALNAITTSVAAEFEGSVAVLDLYRWMQGRTDDATLRPDGAHFAYAQPTDLSEALPALLAAALATT